MDERERQPPEIQLGQLIGELTVGTARAMAALAEAVAKQANIDRDALLDEWFSIIPPEEQTVGIESLLYRAIDQLTAGSRKTPPPE